MVSPPNFPLINGGTTNTLEKVFQNSFLPLGKGKIKRGFCDCS
jgi:hypothetical protein